MVIFIMSQVHSHMRAGGWAEVGGGGGREILFVLCTCVLTMYHHGLIMLDSRSFGDPCIIKNFSMTCIFNIFGYT